MCLWSTTTWWLTDGFAARFLMDCESGRVAGSGTGGRVGQIGLFSGDRRAGVCQPGQCGGLNKTPNQVRDYEAAIASAREAGVLVNPSFVLGLDGDGPDRSTRHWIFWTGSRLLWPHSTSRFRIPAPNWLNGWSALSGLSIMISPGMTAATWSSNHWG